jgi:CRP/FNR family transcriptional regulator, anaerobic regulatory protein
MNAPLDTPLLNLYPALAAVDAQIRADVLAQAQVFTVPAGTVLFDEHQPCRGFPFVLAGAVRVVKSAANGR